MLLKTFVAGLGACVFFLAGTPGHAKVSFAFDIKATEQRDSPLMQGAESGTDLKSASTNLLLANNQNFRFNRSKARNNSLGSNLRQKNTRKKGRGSRSYRQFNRQNNSRFIHRNGGSRFSNQNLRSNSTRGRGSSGRSSFGNRNTRDIREINKRPKSRKFTFFTPDGNSR